MQLSEKEKLDVFKVRMSFQPWKEQQVPSSAAAANHLYRNKVKNGGGDMETTGQSSSSLQHPFELQNADYVPSSSQLEADQQHAKHPSQSSQNGMKFSIFSQLLNLNKINAFDNLLLNASMTFDDDDLNSDKRQGMKKLMEQAIR